MQTLIELYRHNDWAWSTLLDASQDLAADDLDRPFELGLGSLLETIRHLYAAERVWFERWLGRKLDEHPHARTLASVAKLCDAHANFAAARNAFIDSAGPQGVAGRIEYKNTQGEQMSWPLGDMMLHVCNHGTYHRAQALNMLRHLGRKAPGLDYLFMRAARPTVEQSDESRAALAQMGLTIGTQLEEPAALTIDTLREYLRYSDWAQQRVCNAAVDLSDEQLDRPFEMGPGTLRKTLLHIHAAEDWWLRNWRGGPPNDFQQLPDTTSPPELTQATQRTITERDEYLAQRTDADVQDIVAAEVRNGVILRFRLGESALQLPTHGTHHRAQAVNMLRRLGVTPPELDYVVFLRES